MMMDGCFDQLDELACTAALLFCSSEVEEPFFLSGKNPYDISVVRRFALVDGLGADGLWYRTVMARSRRRFAIRSRLRSRTTST